MSTIENQITSSLENSLIEQVQTHNTRFRLIEQEIKKIIIGNDETIELIMTALLCNGHLLVEGLPGVAKTTLIKTVTDVLNLHFQRIQFTPDLLPADLIGTLVYNQKTGDFEARKGPLFAHIILADEINRAPAKVQSALLEAMQEQQVTIGNNTYPLPKPFFVFATQNPIEQEGTYSLPEAQVDRFMMKLRMGYPTILQEKQLLLIVDKDKKVSPCLDAATLFDAQKIVQAIYSDTLIVDYIARLIEATRFPDKYNLSSLAGYLKHGASPRASIALFQASKAQAFLQQRDFVIPDDVKKVFVPIVAHRLITTFGAETDGMTNEVIASKILQTVPTP